MAKAEWGAKRACQSCGAKYYDMQRSPIICPKCGTEFDPDALLKSRRVRGGAAAKPEAPKPKPKPVKAEAAAESEEKADGEDLEDLVEDDDEDEALIEDASELDDEDDMSDVVVEDDEKDDT